MRVTKKERASEIKKTILKELRIMISPKKEAWRDLEAKMKMEKIDELTPTEI